MIDVIKGVVLAAVVVSVAIATPIAQIMPPTDDDVAKYVRAQMEWRLVPV